MLFNDEDKLGLVGVSLETLKDNSVPAKVRMKLLKDTLMAVTLQENTVGEIGRWQAVKDTQIKLQAHKAEQEKMQNA